MATGVVKWWNDEKGFGFITPHGAGAGAKDVFVHFSGIKGTGHKGLEEGQNVEYRTEPGRKGEQAVDVTVI